MTATDDPFKEPFGSLFGPAMTVATLADGAYTYGGSAQPLENFSMHPVPTCCTTRSACFEGLKAHRQVDGSLAIFRLDDHVRRMLQSVAKSAHDRARRGHASHDDDRLRSRPTPSAPLSLRVALHPADTHRHNAQHRARRPRRAVRACST